MCLRLWPWPRMRPLCLPIRGITTKIYIFLSQIELSLMVVNFVECRTVPLGNATQENIEKMTKYPGQIIYRCPRCLSIKPMRAHHCSVCKRCVKKMDHHCPWYKLKLTYFDQNFLFNLSNLVLQYEGSTTVLAS